MENSRKTIVVMSPNYLESKWARYEIHWAEVQVTIEKRPKIITIMYGDIGNVDNLSKEIRDNLKYNTYLKWGDSSFWDKLRYAMPHKRIPSETCSDSCFHRLLKLLNSWICKTKNVNSLQEQVELQVQVAAI